jgi:hypothetical protein
MLYYYTPRNHQNHFTQRKHDSKCGRKYKKKQGEAPIAYLREDSMAIMVLM